MESVRTPPKDSREIGVARGWTGGGVRYARQKSKEIWKGGEDWLWEQPNVVKEKETNAETCAETSAETCATGAGTLPAPRHGAEQVVEVVVVCVGARAAHAHPKIHVAHPVGWEEGRLGTGFPTRKNSGFRSVGRDRWGDELCNDYHDDVGEKFRECCLAGARAIHQGCLGPHVQRRQKRERMIMVLELDQRCTVCG